MDAPEVRLSPDGWDVAIRNGALIAAPWRVSTGEWFTDAAVSDWTLLLPAPNQVGPR